jgi:ectoine hydroxylase-related dioxygenase (phytanoyl-CoA dioxygenase family)
MRPVFKDAGLQAQFDKKGYVILPEPFLRPEEVEELKQCYFDTLPERGGNYEAAETTYQGKSAVTYDFTMTDRNWKYKEKVFEIITTRFQPHYASILDNYQPIIANFIRKEEKAGEVPLHQNWAFVDERAYTSVSIWVPLVDSNIDNGTLQMLDGSHKRFGELRGPMIPWECLQIGQELIDHYMTPITARAGTAVVLDDSIIHYSNINQTNGLRLTIQLIMIPAEAQLVHHYIDLKKPDEVHVLALKREFFLHFHPWLKPEGEVLAVKPFKAHQLNIPEFKARMKAPRIDAPKTGFLHRVKQLLGT